MMQAPALFLVVLGGRIPRANIELHDVRFVAGSCIDDTIPELRRQWFGHPRGLHLDSYTVIRAVDGFQVLLAPDPADQEQRLFFVNVGGYDPGDPMELHQFDLVVARSPQQARSRALKRLLPAAEQRHKDDLRLIDDCLALEAVGGWHVHLRQDPAAAAQPLRPDWTGYRRIDRD